MMSRVRFTANDNSKLIASHSGDQWSCADVMKACTPFDMSFPVLSENSGVDNLAKARVIENLAGGVSDILTISRHNIRPVPENCPEPKKQNARGILATHKRMVCLDEPVGICPAIESEAA